MTPDGMTGFSQFLTSQEGALRSGVFFGLLILFLALERLRPRRRQQVSARHFISNLAFGVLNAVILRFALPGGLVLLAIWFLTAYPMVGLMGWLNLPPFVEFIACLVLLDLVLYWQHRLFHQIDFFWKFHSAHHGDRNLNVSSGVRFHPGEALVSLAVKAVAIMALGVPVAAIILFEVLLNAASLFNHANWSLGRLDAYLQKLIVTPDMHRLHHSRLETESRKNFGFFLSGWDTLFNSYKAHPDSPHSDIALGLDDMPDDGFVQTLQRPFKPSARKT
ncbi:MAG: sterol desaturase family protein [Rhodobiaceae bacterium]|nr:sterol desaturase family protein [Rhodobiaceae bacterium]